MREQRISQTTLATALGLSQQAVSRRLTGEVPFTLPELEIAAHTLDTTLATLAGTTGSQ